MITTPPAADLRRRIMAGLIAVVTVAALVVALATVLTRSPAAEGGRREPTSSTAAADAPVTVPSEPATVAPPDDTAQQQRDAAVPTPPAEPPDEQPAPSADAGDRPGPPAAARTPTVPPADATCTLEPDRPGLPEVRLTYPGDWYVAGDDWSCGFFDPDPDVVVAPATEIHGVDVWWKYEHVPFDVMVSPSETMDETSRTETTIAGRRAVRIAGTATGVGMYEAGVPTTLWVIDLGGDSDDGVTLLGAVIGVDCVDCDRAVEVLDQMAARVAIAGS